MSVGNCMLLSNSLIYLTSRLEERCEMMGAESLHFVNVIDTEISKHINSFRLQCSSFEQK